MGNTFEKHYISNDKNKQVNSNENHYEIPDYGLFVQEKMALFKSQNSELCMDDKMVLISKMWSEHIKKLYDEINNDICVDPDDKNKYLSELNDILLKCTLFECLIKLVDKDPKIGIQFINFMNDKKQRMSSDSEYHS